MMPRLDFGREVCGDTASAGAREWLVTNGLGGFASGTIASMHTRRYHGLLMAALDPPLGRTLLLAKLDETVEYGSLPPESHRRFPLYLNQWATGDIEPNGHHHLNRFHLEGTIPTWTYGIADAELEKRIWMQPGANTTYIQYRLTRATGPLHLEAKALVNYRDYHNTTTANHWRPRVDLLNGGIRMEIFDGAVPLHLFSDRAEILPHFEWYQGFFLNLEKYRGQRDVEEDHIYSALVRISLDPGESFALVASTEESPNLDGMAAFEERRAHEQGLIDAAARVWQGSPLSDPVRTLTLAADQFVVKRSSENDPDGRSIIAGYPWFGDWGRDTMISLPGLTLTTGRPEVAAAILLTFSQFVDKGMLPNRFPDSGEIPEYNTVDATLWYFQAIRAYYHATHDETLLSELFPILSDIIQWHLKGTRYHIHMDERDGLIHAGLPGVQLTWMDAKAGDWVVTPRIGKPVEINALWYSALCTLSEFARTLGRDPDGYTTLAAQAKVGFRRFWNEALGCCYDLLDGPNGHDDSLRPNQLFAVSLPHTPLTNHQQRSVVDTCARHLVTPHGLRSLSPDHDAYIGRYGGDQHQRDGAYHQGIVWSWLIGPFVSAHLRVYQDPALARSFLKPLIHHLAGHGVGSVSEIFDGDPPFHPRGCIAQAWSIAELLRTWHETET